MHSFFYNTPIGLLGIEEKDGKIYRIYFSEEKDKMEAAKSIGVLQETPLIKEAAEQLRDYFEGKRRAFDLPLALEGTPFQKAAWEALMSVPYGETRSYKDIAVAIGNPKACRAIGMANNRNPVVIVVPCHRIIGHSGKLTGYGGGLPIKDYLLKLEKSNSMNDMAGDEHNEG